MKYFQMALLFFLSFHLGHCSRESRKLHQAILECETQEQPNGDGWRKKGRNDGESVVDWVTKYSQNLAAMKWGRPEEWGPEWSGPYRHKRPDGLPEDVLYWWDSENKQAVYKKKAVGSKTKRAVDQYNEDSDGGYEILFTAKTAIDIHPTSFGWQPHDLRGNNNLQPPTMDDITRHWNLRHDHLASDGSLFANRESPPVEPGDDAADEKALAILDRTRGAWDEVHDWPWVEAVRKKYLRNRKKHMDEEELAVVQSNVRFEQGGFTELWQGRWWYFEPYFKHEFDLWPVNVGFVLYSKGPYTYENHENAELDRDSMGWYRGDVFREYPPRIDGLKVRHAWQKAIIIQHSATDKKAFAKVKDTDWAVGRMSYPGEMYPVEGTNDSVQNAWDGTDLDEAELAQKFGDFVGLMDDEEDNYRYEEGGRQMLILKKLQEYDFSGYWWYRTEDDRSIWYRLERQSSLDDNEVEYTFFESDPAGNFSLPGRKLHHEGGGVFLAASNSFPDFGRKHNFKYPGESWSTGDDRDRAVKIHLGWIRVIVMEYQETFKPKTERVALRKYHLQNFRFEGRATGQVGMFQSSAAASRPWML